MEYKGVEFTVRARPGHNHRLWAISPKGAPTFSHEFAGSREDACANAQQAIDRWLEKHPVPADKAGQAIG